MNDDRFNSYGFTSLGALRAALRHYRVLEGMHDVTSATILLDLRRALGDDPGFPIRVLTSHQRLAIKRYLIDDLPARRAADELGIHERVLYTNVNRGLKRIMKWLHNSELRDWQPWQVDLLRDPLLTTEQIAKRIGRSEQAVRNATLRLREREGIPYRSASRRTSSTTPQPQHSGVDKCPTSANQ